LQGRHDVEIVYLISVMYVDVEYVFNWYCVKHGKVNFSLFRLVVQLYRCATCGSYWLVEGLPALTSLFLSSLL